MHRKAYFLIVCVSLLYLDFRAANLKEHVMKWITDWSRMDTGIGACVFGSELRLSELQEKFPYVFLDEDHAIGRGA